MSSQPPLSSHSRSQAGIRLEQGSGSPPQKPPQALGKLGRGLRAEAWPSEAAVVCGRDQDVRSIFLLASSGGWDLERASGSTLPRAQGEPSLRAPQVGQEGRRWRACPVG